MLRRTGELQLITMAMKDKAGEGATTTITVIIIMLVVEVTKLSVTLATSLEETTEEDD